MYGPLTNPRGLWREIKDLCCDWVFVGALVWYGFLVWIIGDAIREIVRYTHAVLILNGVKLP